MMRIDPTGMADGPKSGEEEKQKNEKDAGSASSNPQVNGGIDKQNPKEKTKVEELKPDVSLYDKKEEAVLPAERYILKVARSSKYGSQGESSAPSGISCTRRCIQ